MADEELAWPDCANKTHLLRLDEQAACAICYGPYDFPLMVPCGHSFCAACIRSNLEYQERTAPARCPLCRERCDTRDLRPNKALQGLAGACQAARAALIELATATAKRPAGVRQQPERAAKRQRTAADQPPASQPRRAQAPEAHDSPMHVEAVEESQEASPGTTEAGSTFSLGNNAAPSSRSEGLDSPDSRPASTAKRRPAAGSKATAGSSVGTAAPAQPAEPRPGYLPCPNCGATVPEAAVNDHLDRCLLKAEVAEKPALARKAPKAKVAVFDLSKLVVPPKLAMTLLKDRDLKQKLAHYGLSVHGKRSDWEARYAQFRVAVQTALDQGRTQASYAEIAAQVAGKERNVSSAKFVGMSKLGTKPAAAGKGGGFSSLIKATQARQHGKAQAGSAADGRAHSDSLAPVVDCSNTPVRGASSMAGKQPNGHAHRPSKLVGHNRASVGTSKAQTQALPEWADSDSAG